MSLRPDPENIAARLSSPVVCTYVDTEKIHFERMRSGVLWKTDRTETVNGYTAKVSELVYTASTPPSAGCCSVEALEVAVDDFGSATPRCSGTKIRLLNP